MRYSSASSQWDIPLARIWQKLKVTQFYLPTSSEPFASQSLCFLPQEERATHRAVGTLMAFAGSIILWWSEFHALQHLDQQFRDSLTPRPD